MYQKKNDSPTWESNSQVGVVLVLVVLIAVPLGAYADYAININTAGKEELTTLTGIGEVKAQNIIDYRDANGLFTTKEEIQNVSGIGSATYDNIKDHITVTGGESGDEEPAQAESEGQENDNATSQGAGSLDDTHDEPAPYESPEPTLFAYAGDDRGVIVGAGALFEGQAISKGGNEILGDVRYIWNFGDGEVAEGKKVMHVWKHPGRYALVLDIAHNKKAASDRIVITARPAEILVSSEGGDIVVANKSSRDLDVSAWHLRAGGLHFTLPENTVILAGEEVRFSGKTTNLDADNDDVALLYPNGEVAEEVIKEEQDVGQIANTTTLGNPIPKETHLGIGFPSESLSPRSVVGVSVVESESKAEPHVQSEGVAQKESRLATSSQVATAAEAAGRPLLPSGIWLYGLMALVAFGAIGVAAARSKSREEYTIVEE